MLEIRGVFQVAAEHVVHAPPSLFGGLGVRRAFGFDVAEPEPVRRNKIPGGTVKIVFALDGTVDGVRRDPSVLVIGMHDRGTTATHVGRMHSVQVQLGPLAARRLLGVPLSEFRNSAVCLDDLFGPSARGLAERLAETARWDERFALVADYLRTHGAHADIDPIVAAAVDSLHATRGAATVAELVAETGWSRRHFARRFGDQVGLSPKAYASLTRFDTALAWLTAADRDRAPDLGQLADRLGYYDQSHLTRDFHRFAGTTPGRLLLRHMSPSSKTTPAADS
ncbi:AraC family transcriptional regulator [Nocardia bhagyanarayanae]|uniref:AraC family transcriptional regulator n=1 Tax=Nocardia bhagyanarayanae TaxID=1215925 RepID=A0A543FDE5_9NOCA|nr:AraC family transcriptional regulator [Nocardia bhagyanarayanae]